ncbi:MAG: hypothetical protein AAGB05_01540 [Pseudomonadota bacterium]
MLVASCTAGAVPPMASPSEVRAVEQRVATGGGGAIAVSGAQNPFGTRVAVGPRPNPLVPVPLEPPSAIIASPSPPIAEQAVTDLEGRRRDLLYGTPADCRAARGTFTVRGCLP